MALDTPTILRRASKMITPLALVATITLLSIGRPSSGQLEPLGEPGTSTSTSARNSNSHDQRQPAIYTISDERDSSPQASSLDSQQAAGQKPYSWSNRRLVIKQNLQEELDGQVSGANGGLLVPWAPNESNQFGDLSLLYSHASSGGQHSSSSSHHHHPHISHQNRWPATNGRPRRPPSGQGTKGVKGTKRRPPVAGRQPPLVDHSPAAVQPDAGSGANQTTSRRAGKRKNLVCYYGTWAVYRPDAGKYPVENIDPFLCTHIIYGFTGLSFDNQIKPLDPWNDLEDNYGKGAMKRFTNLKRVNPDLKALVAIGGWNEGSIKYSKMASDPEARRRFVDSVVQFLAKYNFDGLDLDWEYPGSRGGASYDKQNFVRLLKELHEAFQPHGYLLTAAVSAGKWFIDPAYDIPQVGKYLDLINLMAYDYHGGWETKTGMNAPLFHSAKHDHSRDELQLNVNWSVNYWLQQGAPREKIMLGVGSYGRSFTLDSAQVNGINAPASQKGRQGPYTREPGSLGYNEICEAFQREPRAWTVVRDPDYLAPYAYNDRQWVGYDDQRSLALKAAYAKSMGLGGMMMWSIETDDFQGRCHNEKYPLLNTMRRVLDGDQLPDVTSPSSFSTTTTTTTTTTRRPSSSTTARPAIVQPASSSTRRPSTTTPGREVEDDEPSRPSSTVAPLVPSTQSTSRRPSKRPSTTSTTSRRPIRPTTTTTTTTQRPPTSQEFACRADGMFADPRNCRKFIRCVSQGASSQQFVMYRFDCAPGTAFNEASQYCDFIYNVPQCQRQRPDEANDSPAGASWSRVAPPPPPPLLPQLITPGVTLHGQVAPARRSAPPMLLVAGYQDAHLRNQHYPGYFSHRFTVHHRW